MKYLFRCKFADGRSYVQTSEDISKKDSSKSAYNDIKDEDISIFWLEGQGHVYLVDLNDGSFEIDGVEFRMHDDFNDSLEKKLVFYKQHTHYMGGTLEISQDVEYCFGWKAINKDGQEVKYLMRIR